MSAGIIDLIKVGNVLGRTIEGIGDVANCADEEGIPAGSDIVNGKLMKFKVIKRRNAADVDSPLIKLFLPGNWPGHRRCRTSSRYTADHKHR